MVVAAPLFSVALMSAGIAWQSVPITRISRVPMPYSMQLSSGYFPAGFDRGVNRKDVVCTRGSRIAFSKHFKSKLITNRRRSSQYQLQTSRSDSQNTSEFDGPSVLDFIETSPVKIRRERVILSLMRSQSLSPGPAMPNIGSKVEYLFVNQPKEGEEWSLGDEWVMLSEELERDESIQSAVQRAIHKVLTPRLYIVRASPAQ
jgi:hypothetical protein